MTTQISIVQIEQAINHWQASDTCPNDGITLEVNARVLADVYGYMIYTGSKSLPQSSLSADQLTALKPIL